MITYQDFLEVIGDESNLTNPAYEKAIGDFILEVINDHKASPEFKIGQIAGEFYRHHDTEQEKVKKYIYDSNGNVLKNKYSTDYKLTSNFHFIYTDEMVSYLLGNGISFDNPDVKKRLGGNKFDHQLKDLLTYAANDGVSYALVTNNGIEPLCFASDNKKPHFSPLLDENNGNIKAGVKYWRIAPEKPLIAVLYTINGEMKFKEYTDENKESGMILIEPLKKYTVKAVYNDIEGDYLIESENYSELPIVPMNYINGQSSIIGNIDALVSYDRNLSDFANDVLDSFPYWILKGYDGMDKEDDMRFLFDLYRQRIIHNEQNQEAVPHQFEIQYQAKEALLTRIEQQLINDYMAADIKSLRSGAVTTVEIKSAYKRLDRKCDDVEYFLRTFIQGILRILKIDENEPFHFTRSKDLDETEAVTNFINASNNTGDAYTTRKILETFGDGDEYERIQKQKSSEEMSIFSDEKQENTIAKIADLIFQKLKQLFTFGKKNDNGDDENV